MASPIGGEFRLTPRTHTATGQYGNLQIDEHGRLLVTTAAEDTSSAYLTDTPDALVLAAPTGSEDGLGKLAATIANTQAIYVRFDAAGYSYADWIVSHAQQADLVFYKALEIADSVSLTLSSFTDTNTIILNGLTLTGEATAADAAFASRKFSTAGGTDTLDAVELAKLINADYAVTTAGTSVAGTDKLLITTDEGLHTLTARAAADLTLGEYTLNSTAATEMANIVLAINHRRNVTLASTAANATVTIQAGASGNFYTYTAHASTTTEAARQFAISGDDTDDAVELCKCINADTATHGYSATNTAGVVWVHRAVASAPEPILTSSTETCVNVSGGVPGVLASATGATAELEITPVWTETLTVTEAGNRLTVVDIDQPGLYATAADGVVTVVPGTPFSRSEGELATVISATAAANCTVSQAGTLSKLIVDADTTAAADEAATTGALGSHHPQAVSGYPYLYLGLTADNATPQAVSVTVKPRV